MLKFLTAAAFLLAMTLGAETESSETSTETSDETSTDESSETSVDTTMATVTLSNYFVDTFVLLDLPYSIGKCSALGLSGDSFIYSECDVNKDNEITVKKYSDETCTTLTETRHYNMTSAQDYRCDGDADSYVAISFGLAGTCGAKVYVALDVCLSFSTLYGSFDCTAADAGELNVYVTPDCSGSSVAEYDYPSTCTSSFTYSVYTIYGSTSECSVAETVDTTDGGSDTTDDGNDDTTAEPASANMISLKNIVGIFVMVIGLIVAAF